MNNIKVVDSKKIDEINEIISTFQDISDKYILFLDWLVGDKRSRKRYLNVTFKKISNICTKYSDFDEDRIIEIRKKISNYALSEIESFIIEFNEFLDECKRKKGNVEIVYVLKKHDSLNKKQALLESLPERLIKEINEELAKYMKIELFTKKNFPFAQEFYEVSEDFLRNSEIEMKNKMYELNIISNFEKSEKIILNKKDIKKISVVIDLQRSLREYSSIQFDKSSEEIYSSILKIINKKIENEEVRHSSYLFNRAKKISEMDLNHGVQESLRSALNEANKE